MAAPRRKSEPSLHDQPSKRRRRSPAGVSGDDGDADDSGLNTRSRNLACHFYKRFPTRFTRCMFRNELTSTSFAVQHLHRAHMHRIQCSNCKRTFDSVAELDGHIEQHETCRGVSPVRKNLDNNHLGLDWRQLANLRCRPRRGRNEKERWFEIWDALFPGVDRPDSPYVSTPEDEILHIARQALERTCAPDTSSQVLEQVLDRLNWSAVSSAFDTPGSGKTSAQGRSEADTPSSCAPSTPPTSISTKLKAGRKFACPFAKRDPGQYKNVKFCYGPGWDNVHRVKEHIYRRHSLKSFCGRCFEHFQESEALKRHQRADIPCQVRAPVSAITEEQDKLLRARAKPHCSEETKWEEMYRIIFPDEKVPSPYYDEDPSAAPKPDPAHFQSMDDCKEFLRTEVPRQVRPAIEQYVTGLVEELQENVKRKTVEILHDVETKVLDTFQFQEEQSLLSALPASRVPLGTPKSPPSSVPGRSKTSAPLEELRDNSIASDLYADLRGFDFDGFLEGVCASSVVSSTYFPWPASADHTQSVGSLFAE